MTFDRTSAFLRVLDPADNATGGGSASAISGAMAAALAAMVARLSSNRAGGEPDAVYREIATRGSELADALLAGADEDARSFDAVMAAYGLPKGSVEEKLWRSAAIQTAMSHATRAPLHNAELCAEVLGLVARLEGRSNPRTLSDLRSAGYLARAGLLGCLANVEINLPGIKDAAVARDFWARAERLVTLSKPSS